MYLSGSYFRGYLIAEVSGIRRRVHGARSHKFRDSLTTLVGAFRQGGRGGGGPSDKGGGHPDPEIMGREGRKSQKNFFQFGLKIRGGRSPGPLPWNCFFH